VGARGERAPPRRAAPRTSEAPSSLACCCAIMTLLIERSENLARVGFEGGRFGSGGSGGFRDRAVAAAGGEGRCQGPDVRPGRGNHAGGLQAVRLSVVKSLVWSSAAALTIRGRGLHACSLSESPYVEAFLPSTCSPFKHSANHDGATPTPLMPGTARDSARPGTAKGR
jgi:hypothetical protein